MTMTEDEIMARAIHAVKQRMRDKGYSPEHVAGMVIISDPCVLSAAIALRNLAIPLSKILPEDPDEREAWAIAKNYTGGIFCRYENRKVSRLYATLLAAIKRGRALAGEGK